MISNFVKGKEAGFYFVFRVFIGVFFTLHGMQKIFGMFGGKVVASMSLFWWAGVIELVGGLFIFLGLFARLAALISAVEMLVAYFYVHAPQGPIPLQNGGELALLYFAGFLVVVAYGAGKWSLEKMLWKKEMF